VPGGVVVKVKVGGKEQDADLCAGRKTSTVAHPSVPNLHAGLVLKWY